MYRSKSSLKTPVWEKENVLDPQGASIAFNRSGVMAFKHQGQIYQKMHAAETWMPIHTNFKRECMHTIFETSDGTVFLGSNNGLYKSADRGKTWKQVHVGGWVMKIAESDGVLLATRQKGILRSTDDGEHWDRVISEGGVGIAVEPIDGGFAAIAYNTRTQTNRTHISLDSGKTWNAIDEGLQPSLYISSIKQVGEYLICGRPDGIFRSSDMGKTWKIVHYRKVVDFGADKTVFKIYVSGNTLYAVARGEGC